MADYIRVTDPNMAVQLVPWFVPENETVQDMLLFLYDRLANCSDETFLCLGVENDIIKGIAIAYKAGEEVFIWQATAAKGVKPYQVDELFDEIKKWARTIGCRRISCIPNRAKRIWERRWGFKQSDRNENEVILEI